LINNAVVLDMLAEFGFAVPPDANLGRLERIGDRIEALGAPAAADANAHVHLLPELARPLCGATDRVPVASFPRALAPLA
jgi:hypothetical protein